MGYSVATKDIDAKVFARSLNISTRNSVDFVKHLRGMEYKKAVSLMEDLLDEERSIKGKYYTKIVEHVLPLFKSAEANAKSLGLDVSRLYVYHISAHKGSNMFRPTRMRFKKGPWKMKNTHIELVLREKKSVKPKEASK